MAIYSNRLPELEHREDNNLGKDQKQQLLHISLGVQFAPA
jgi:hypothetical protein